MPIVIDRSSESGGAWVCHFRCSSCEIVYLAWLPNCAWCPPLLNLWTRRRLVLEPVGGSGVDIVNFKLFVCADRFSAGKIDVLFVSIVLLLYKGTHRFFDVSIRLMYQENQRIDSNHDSIGRRIDTIMIRLGDESILS